MRHLLSACLFLSLGIASAQVLAAAKSTSQPAVPADNNAPGQIEVTADKSLEWYEDKKLYVARGNAKAIRGDTTVEADVLTAHQKEKADQDKAAAKQSDRGATGDMDKMTAEGHVRVTTPTTTITGDHGVYDLNQHVAYVTGDNLKYVSDGQTVTAKQSLEYWEDKKLAVARGNAVAVKGDRHVEADVLTALFRDMPNGKTELHTMTADGNVVILTANDVTRGDRAVFDVSRNIAVVSGHVRITRADGTQLTGDVGEVDFAANRSRLLNEGHGRVRALLTSKSSPKAAPKQTAASP